MGALTFGLLALPRSNPSSVSFASEVRQALQNANTWHLKGWKWQFDRRVPWEVWGRRQPFFYREQVGSALIVDDGMKCKAFFAAEEGHCPFVLITPSDPQAKSIRWSYQKMVAKWRSDLKPWKETAGEVIFDLPESAVPAPRDTKRAPDAFFTINKQTRLPVRYEMRQTMFRQKQKQVSAQLSIEFDTPLPDSILVPPQAPAGALVYDLTLPQDKMTAHLPNVNTVSQNSITAQFMPLVMDADGHILMRLRGWLAGTPIGPKTPFFAWEYTKTNTGSDVIIEPSPTRDDRGRAYTGVNWDDLQQQNGDLNPIMAFAPVEPLPHGTPLPRTLTLLPVVSIQLHDMVQDTFGLVDNRLFQCEGTVTVSLPQRTRPIDVSAYLKPGRQNVIYGDTLENRKAATYFARAHYYSQAINGLHPDRPRLTRAIVWQRKGIAASTSSTVQLDRGQLAQLYMVLGDFKDARQILQEIITESHRFPKRAAYDRNMAKGILEYLARRERRARPPIP
jgi:hypothetical protein